MTSPTREDLDNWFVHHPPGDAQISLYEAVRSAGYEMAEVVMDMVPEGREKSTAIAKIREAVMWANAGIACSPIMLTEDETVPEGLCDKEEVHEGHPDERDGLRFWCTGGVPVVQDRPEDREPEDQFATDFGGDPNGER